MGEMLKLTFKSVLIAAVSAAILAGMLICVNTLGSFVTMNIGQQAPALLEMFRVVTLVIPINIRVLFSVITSLFGFKLAVWAGHMFLNFVDSLG